MFTVYLVRPVGTVPYIHVVADGSKKWQGGRGQVVSEVKWSFVAIDKKV
jgi:hypothetical protein